MAPACRRYLRVRHPLTGVLGAYLFLPFGLGPSPGWNDRCVKAVFDVARPQCPTLRIVDFAGDIRLVGATGEHDALAAGTAGLMSLLDQMGIRFHTKEGKGWWPTRSIPWLGFGIYTRSNVVRMGERKVEKGPRSRDRIFEYRPVATMQGRELLATVSYCHLRSGRFLPPALWVGRGE